MTMRFVHAMRGLKCNSLVTERKVNDSLSMVSNLHALEESHSLLVQLVK